MANRTPPRRRPAGAVGRVVRRGSRAVARRVDVMFAARGPGFRKVAESHAYAVMGDTLVTLSLANTLFFQVPSTQARDNVALYLLITLAPFAVIGPLLGALFVRFPAAYRGGMAVSAIGRAGVALAMVLVGVRTLWLFPLAFLLLVFSRFHGISRSSLLPTVLDRPVELVSANARIARIGVLAGAVAVPLGALANLIDTRVGLLLASVVFGLSLAAAVQVPTAPGSGHPASLRPEAGASTPRRSIPRSVRLARLATAGVRLLNGFLLLIVAFEFRDVDAGFLDFGFLLGAAGLGFFLAAFVSPWLEHRLREEPMVVAALAVEAAAAFIAAQAFGLPAAGALAAAAGFAWGTAKFGFDGLLQATVDPGIRAVTFTSSETFFQLVWVLGAIVPTVVSIPIDVGLAVAGIAALGAQVVYVSGLLGPLTSPRRRQREPETSPEDAGIADYF